MYEQKGKDLETLLRRDYDASRLYLSLPDEAKNEVKSQADSIDSLEGLKTFAENYLKRDDVNFIPPI